ncbi:MAG: response regulator [Pseudohongiellaceae bacterium]
MNNSTGPILVIDDERDICELVQLSLEGLGFEVLVRYSGEEGLELIKQRGSEVQLILLDLAMPGLSGIDTLARIRMDLPDVPVIVMSGYVTDKSEAAALGASGILQKPFLLNDVEAQVKRILAG